MLTSLLLSSGLDQAIVLAPSEEATSIVVNDVKFFRLAHWIKEDQAPVPTVA